MEGLGFGNNIMYLKNERSLSFGYITIILRSVRNERVMGYFYII